MCIINIMDIKLDDPVSQVRRYAVLYSGSAFGSDVLVKPVENFNRVEKLTYIEVSYRKSGLSADSDKTMMEIKYSRGLSREAFNRSREYGLFLYDKDNAH